MKADTRSSLPRMGRATGWSPKWASMISSCTTSSGASSAMAISSSTTPFSFSSSTGSNFGAVARSAEHVDGQGQVFIHHLGVKAGALLGGKGVELAAHGVHFLGDLAGGALLRALEGHVLKEVADAGLRGNLILRARAQPQAHRHGAHMVEPLADDAQAVGKRDLVKQGKTCGCGQASHRAKREAAGGLGLGAPPAMGEGSILRGIMRSGPRGRNAPARGGRHELMPLTASGDGRRGRARRGRHRGAGDGARAWIRRRTGCRCG